MFMWVKQQFPHTIIILVEVSIADVREKVFYVRESVIYRKGLQVSLIWGD